MNLIIKNSGSRKFPYWRIMDGNEEFCATSNRDHALIIIKALEEDEAINLKIEQPKTLDEILKTIFDKTGIDLKTNLSQKREIVNVRFIYCKIAIDHGFTLKETGIPIHRLHDRVLYACRKFNDYYQTDPEFRELYKKITKL